SYTESLAKFEEAEALLNSIGIASEKDRLGKDGSTISKEGKRMYRVIFNRKNRDCLWRIAGKVYKNERLWPLIYVANKDQIKDPDLIFPGQKFIIPEIPEKEGKSDKSKLEEKSESGKDAGGATPETKTDSTDEE
ncbi:MAG TPA: LysM peptidoglycan-binding domain-containing protein, partial [Spirochaetota bacterium]|nr:LysM peptidoglycan-binding domain-containing protein [Spirochaetota bacterium]